MNKEQLKILENDLWAAADNLRANSDLKSSEYATPVLGLIFLKFADNNYRRHEAEIKAEYDKLQGTRRERSIVEIAISRCGFYLPDNARYDYLLNQPESENIAKLLKEAMEAIEEHKPELDGVLPKDEYFPLIRTDRTIPAQLLKTFANIPRDAKGDMLGQIYQYFLEKFALAEGQGGGEFFTPTSVVKLMVEIIEPYQGTVFDPACGSGGMFVQSASFGRSPLAPLEKGGMRRDIFVYGQEKTLDTVNLAKMNIVVNGLRGDVRRANTYYEDLFQSFGKFDYVLANPPFNVDDVNQEKVEADQRFNTYGVPKKKTKAKKSDKGKETVPNANYLWINLFATSLKEKGRAALVMANSASDARHSEADIRKTLIENNLIYGMLTLPSNMFYTVRLPATLWFFDKGKQDNRILFIDARNIFTQISRKLREFSEEQIQNIAIISKLHRGNSQAFINLIDGYFARGMELLLETQSQIEPISQQLLEVLADKPGRAAVKDLVGLWSRAITLPTDKKENTIPPTPLDKRDYSDVNPEDKPTSLEKEGDFAAKPEDTPTPLAKGGSRGDLTLYNRYQNYLEHAANLEDISGKNKAQQELSAVFVPFFSDLHQGLKQLDKVVRQQEKTQAEAAKAEGKRATTSQEMKKLKSALEALHQEVKKSEGFYKHIQWLQERFPQAEYEDVTGLCKLATLEEVKEQDYSLNPGRYVGVVIEEDGKTEEEFISEILDLDKKLKELSINADTLNNIISGNILALTGEE